VPRNLAAANVTSFSITVSWLEPAVTNGTITGYVVNVTSDSEVVSINAMTAETCYMVSLLTPFTNYTFRIAAMTNAGTGMSAVITVATLQSGRQL
jgi:hypothetical protein